MSRPQATRMLRLSHWLGRRLSSFTSGMNRANDARIESGVRSHGEGCTGRRKYSSMVATNQLSRYKAHHRTGRRVEAGVVTTASANS